MTKRGAKGRKIAVTSVEDKTQIEPFRRDHHLLSFYNKGVARAVCFPQFTNSYSYFSHF